VEEGGRAHQARHRVHRVVVQERRGVHRT
jgi:hypothetical protein